MGRLPFRQEFLQTLAGTVGKLELSVNLLRFWWNEPVVIGLEDVDIVLEPLQQVLDTKREGTVGRLSVTLLIMYCAGGDSGSFSILGTLRADTAVERVADSSDSGEKGSPPAQRGRLPCSSGQKGSGQPSDPHPQLQNPLCRPAIYGR